MFDGFTRIITRSLLFLNYSRQPSLFLSLRTEWPTTLLRRILPLIFIILIPFPFAAAGVFSTSLPEFFVRLCWIAHRASTRPAPMVSVLLASSTDRCRFARIGRELRVPAASVSRQWSCSSSTMVDRTYDTSNELFSFQNWTKSNTE